MKRKILIIGTAPDSKLLAPYDDAGFDVWATAGNGDSLPRVDLVFELHDLECLKKFGVADVHFEKLKAHGPKVVLQKPHADHPNAVIFPKDVVMEEFGDYFTSSAAWMLAWAILHNPEEIAVYGINMNHDEEYREQRPCFEYFIGLARGRGIKVTLAEQSPLGKCRRIYAYGHDDSYYTATSMIEEAEKAKEKAKQEMETAIGRINYFSGAKDALMKHRDSL